MLGTESLIRLSTPRVCIQQSVEINSSLNDVPVGMSIRRYTLLSLINHSNLFVRSEALTEIVLKSSAFLDTRIMRCSMVNVNRRFG
jgi:hypothetical protein